MELGEVASVLQLAAYSSQFSDKEWQLFCVSCLHRRQVMAVVSSDETPATVHTTVEESFSNECGAL